MFHVKHIVKSYIDDLSRELIHLASRIEDIESVLKVFHVKHFQQEREGWKISRHDFAILRPQFWECR